MSEEDLDRQLGAAHRALPEAERHPEARGRVFVPGCLTDDGRSCVLLVVNEADGSWSFYAPGSPGVRVTCDMVVAMAAAILGHAR